MIILGVYFSCFFFIPVFYILRRILPEVQPQTFAGLLGIVQLPPKDFGILARSSSEAITPNDIGIADVFLSCIAKALTLQVSWVHFLWCFLKVFKSLLPEDASAISIIYCTPIGYYSKLFSFWHLKVRKKGPPRCSRRWASSAKNWAFFLSFRCQTKQLFRVENSSDLNPGFYNTSQSPFWWLMKWKNKIFFTPQIINWKKVSNYYKVLTSSFFNS